MRGDRWQIALDGPLAPAWAGNLAAGFARAGISIDHGHARRVGAGLWTARFEVIRTLRASDDPRGLDIAALAATDAGRGFATPLELDHFALHTSLDHGGTLRLRVYAADAVGFLASLLRRLAYFALFPAKLQLETLDTRIADELWLCAAGGRTPSTATTDALRWALAALVRSQE
jgi:hypothetical protein